MDLKCSITTWIIHRQEGSLNASKIELQVICSISGFPIASNVFQVIIWPVYCFLMILISWPDPDQVDYIVIKLNLC